MTTIYLKSQTKAVSVTETATAVGNQIAMIKLPGFLVLYGFDDGLTLVDASDISVVIGDGPE